MTEEVNNRRTFCDHCSLRADLPPFIGREHAQSNANRITKGDIFPCHMMWNPGDTKTAKACLGAALMAGAKLSNPPTDERPLHESLETYVEYEASGRISEPDLMMCDLWSDRNQTKWYGWWAKAKSGTWSYLMSTYEAWCNDSVYLFFDQCQDIYGPLEPHE